MTSNISHDEIDILKNSVYLAARDNNASRLKTLLCDHDDSVIQEVISHHTEEDGQWTTPLLIAARNGHSEVLRELICNFKADVNETGTIITSGDIVDIVEGVTPLWCAALIGNLSMVICLVFNGAEVNKTTANGSTPLRAACFGGYMDIIMYLVIEKGADVSIQNKKQHTCLMLSSYKGNREVVTLLLDNGAPVNVKNNESKTALYFALDKKHYDIAKILVKAGAKNSADNKNISCLKIAAYQCNKEMVEFIITSTNCSRMDKIDAYELLGASLANTSANEGTIEPYSYLRKGMIERFSDPIQYKSLPDPTLTFKNHVECQTLKELEAIKDDKELFNVEALVVKERILGNHNEVHYDVRYRGAVFADNNEYNKCLPIYLYAATMMQRGRKSISGVLIDFVWVFVDMISEGVITEIFTQGHIVFEKAIDELKYDKDRIGKNNDASPNDYLDNYEQNVHSCLHLLIVLLKVTQSPLETKCCVY